MVGSVVAGAMVMTGVLITGCAIRVPSSEVPAMNLSDAPATEAGHNLQLRQKQ